MRRGLEDGRCDKAAEAICQLDRAVIGYNAPPVLYAFRLARRRPGREPRGAAPDRGVKGRKHFVGASSWVARPMAENRDLLLYSLYSGDLDWNPHIGTVQRIDCRA